MLLLLNDWEEYFRKKNFTSISFSFIFIFVHRVSSCWCFVKRKAPRTRSKHGSSGIHDSIRWSKEFWTLVSLETQILHFMFVEIEEVDVNEWELRKKPSKISSSLTFYVSHYNFYDYELNDPATSKCKQRVCLRTSEVKSDHNILHRKVLINSNCMSPMRDALTWVTPALQRP